MGNGRESATEVEIQDIYRLSPMQEGLLFHTLLEPESCLYLGQVSWQLTGPLNLSALRRTWQELIERHTILRTAFVWEDLDQPLQVVQSIRDVPLDVQDWRGLRPENQQDCLEQYLEADRNRSFSLTTAPLLRLAVLRMSDTLQYLVWSQHHLLLDGWSTLLVLKEMRVIYDAYSRGEEIHLSPVRPYRDYIAWLASQDAKEAEEFWRQSLRGAVPTSIQTSKVARGTVRIRGEHRLSIPRAVIQAAVEMARSRGLTLNTLVQGAWAVLLSRYSGQTDVIFGGTVSGRTASLPGIEEMVGIFINTLPVRTRAEGTRCVASWLAEFQQAQADARRFEYAPLVSVQRWSEIPADTQLFDTLISFQNLHVNPQSDRASANERNGHAVRQDMCITEANTFENPHYALSLTVGTGDDMTLVATYDQRRLPADVVDRLMQHFRMLFEGIVNHPDGLVRDLTMLTVGDILRLSEAPSAPVRDHTNTRCIHELVALQVLRTPDSVAVAFEDQCLTYVELEGRSNRLAKHLTELGVGPEQLVGIWVERSLEMVIAVLGILKAGAAYVPLETSCPKDRLAFIVGDCGAQVLLTDKNLLGQLPDLGPATRILCLEDIDWQGTESCRFPQTSCVTADNAAYAIYTSGSTGMPKGVVVSHASVVRLFHATEEWFHFHKEDVWTLFHSYAFDVSVWEMWGALLHGGRLVVVPSYVSRSPEDLYKLLGSEGVTVLSQTPSVFRHLMQAEQMSGPDPGLKLRYIIFAGEALDFDSLRPWIERHGDQCPRLVNMYGITEITVHATYRLVRLQDLDSSRSVVGVPIPDLRLHLLDSDLQPVPVGVAGEIFVSGEGLARGYMGRPELTAERFVPNPFTMRSSQRLYKSGDLGQWLPDGDIEYLGRIDHQVKIRGFRVELGEIEATLGRYPGVRAAVVVLRQDEGEARLIGYVVPNNDLPPSIVELRSFLKDRLPSYMVPSAFIFLDVLPLNASGKVDRNALPSPRPEQIAGEIDYEPPRTPVEEMMASIWERVLNRERVGRRENFFDVGGHSLMVTQVISRVRSTFHVDLPLRVLYRAPTIESMAREVEQTRRKEPIVPIASISRQQELPLSFAQQRLWFLDQLEGGSVAYNLPFGWRFKGELNRDALQRSLQEIVRRHEILRTVFPQRDGRPFQRILPQPEVRIDEVDLHTLEECAREEAALQHAKQDANLPFDLARGPLFRVKLLRLGQCEHGLLLITHHIVSDAWSMNIMAQELCDIYEAYSRGKDHQLPVQEIQYADYSVWQRASLQGPALEKQLGYWKKQLDQPPILKLPADYARPATSNERGDVVPFELPEHLTFQFKQLARREGVTLFMALLTCWQLVLSRSTGQQDIIVGTGIANRSRLELEGLIGFFVNTLALRTSVRNGLTFRQLLAEVRETVLQAYEHQDIPFEKIVEELAPDRSLENSPLLQAMLVLENAPKKRADMRLARDLHITPAFQVTPFAKQDLSLYVWEDEGSITGSAIYKTELFRRSSILKLLDRLKRVMTAVCFEDVNADIAELQLEDQRETSDAIAEFTSDIG